jgi:hypothetical protein
MVGRSTVVGADGVGVVPGHPHRRHPRLECTGPSNDQIVLAVTNPVASHGRVAVKNSRPRRVPLAALPAVGHRF